MIPRKSSRKERACYPGRVVEKRESMLPRKSSRKEREHVTHARVLLGAVGDDLYVVGVHVVAEEVVEVGLGALASEHVQTAVPLREREDVL